MRPLISVAVKPVRLPFRLSVTSFSSPPDGPSPHLSAFLHFDCANVLGARRRRPLREHRQNRKKPTFLRGRIPKLSIGQLNWIPELRLGDAWQLDHLWRSRCADPSSRPCRSTRQALGRATLLANQTTQTTPHFVVIGRVATRPVRRHGCWIR